MYRVRVGTVDAVTVRVFAHSGLEVREGRRGRGVFAARAFAEGEHVEVCPTVELPSDETDGLLGDYVFDSVNGNGAVVLVLGYGMLYNHSEQANLAYDQDERTVTFTAARAIEPDEELTIDYGTEWWRARDEDPVPETG
jgi:hypothetical protein